MTLRILILATFGAALISCGGTAVTSSSSISSFVSSTASSSSSSQLSSVNSSSSAQALVIEEQQAGFCRYSGVIDNSHTGFTGSGFVDTENTLGATIDWSVKAANSGTYTLRIRYANGSADSRAATINVNNAFAASAQLVSTSGWTDWQAETISVYLGEGANALALSAETTAGLPNIDRLEIIGAGLSAGECETHVSSTERFPANTASGISPDVHLQLTFDAPPTVASSGTIEIYDASSGVLADRLSLQGDTLYLGFNGQDRVRGVNYSPLQVVGKQVQIIPHGGSLNYAKTYYVVIADGLLNGTIGGQPYRGDNRQSWQFSTKANGPSGATVTVDDDGPADFHSVQGALNYLMQNTANNSNSVVNIRNGLYHGLLYLREKNNLRLVGESRDGVLLQADNFEGLNPGSGSGGTRGSAASGGRSLFLIEGSDLLSIENLTIKNAHLRASASTGNQAETLYFNNASGRLIAKNANFISEQDTLLLKGYNWFYNTLVAGNVDFIWGYSAVALFENSEIRSLGDSKNGGSGDGGGYILQSRGGSSADYGFVFLNSKLTWAKGPLGNGIGAGKTYLARTGNSGGSTSFYDNFAFINCQMDNHIAAVGWFDESSNNRLRNPSQGTATYGYREYGSTNLSGAALDLSVRQGAYRLNANEVAQYYGTRKQIFYRFNSGAGWDPSI